MLSVIIITKNEECNLKHCLESVKWADEIVVVDSGSEDETVNIAKQYTNKVFSLTPADWQGYGIQKQRALDKATGEWVLNIDADEVVSTELKQSILEAIHKNKADAYCIPIRFCFYGKTLRYSSSPKRHVRLFKRQGAKYSNDIVHEKIILPKEARVSKLFYALTHRSFQDISHALYKINRYSSYTARIRINEKKNRGLFKTLFGASWMFLRCYFLQRGFMDGKAGLTLAILNAHGTFYRGLKQLYPDNVNHPS